MDPAADVEKKLGLSLDELIAQQKAKQAKKGATPGGKGGKGKAKGPARVRASPTLHEPWASGQTGRIVVLITCMRQASTPVSRFCPRFRLTRADALQVQKVQTKGGGRVLVVPRPKHVPRPSSALKATRGGGVHKGGPAPKPLGGGGGARGGGQSGAGRSVKVTIGNKLRWVLSQASSVAAGGLRRSQPTPLAACWRRCRQQTLGCMASPPHCPPTLPRNPPACSGRPATHIPTSGVLAKPFMSGGGGGGGRASRASAMQMDGPGGYGGGGGGGGGALGTRFDHMQEFASSGPARPTGAPRRNAHGVILP